MKKVLLLSNSTLPGTPFFTWPRPFVKEFLDSNVRQALFIPFAAVTFSVDEYEQKVAEIFREFGVELTSIHHSADMLAAVNSAQAIVVGGGNTFALLSRIYKHKLVKAIHDRVYAGTPYIGWSAGANLACPTIMTTNDMPVIQPPSFDALNLVPFQINPHYHELKFEGQGGETRKERLEEFLVTNPARRVIGLPEGMLIEGNDEHYVIKGNSVAKEYRAGREVRDLVEGDSL